MDVACAGGVCAGAATTGTETGGELFAIGGAECFRVKKKVAATTPTTRTIAAAEMTISVEFDLVGRFGWAAGDVTFTAGAEGSAGTVAACGGGICGFGGADRTLSDGTRRGGAMPG